MFTILVSAALAAFPAGGVEVVSWALPEGLHGTGACEVVLWGAPDGEVGVELGRCESAMVGPVVAAAEKWRLAPGAEGRQVPLLFVAQDGRPGVAIVDGDPAVAYPDGIGSLEVGGPEGAVQWDVKVGTRMPPVGDGCAVFFDVDVHGRAKARGDVGCSYDLTEQLIAIGEKAKWTAGTFRGAPIAATTRLELYFLSDARVKEVRKAYRFDLAPAVIAVAGGLSARAASVPGAVLPEGLCDVTLRVGGVVPSEVRVDGCEGPLRDAVAVAARRWRFVPPERESLAMIPFVSDARGVRAGVITGPVDAETFKARFVELDPPRVKKSSALTWPDAASTAPATGVLCRYLVSVDEKGGAAHVDVDGCPEAYRADNPQKIAGWTYVPAQTGGQPIPSKVAIGIVYRPPPKPSETLARSEEPRLTQRDALFRFPQADIGLVAFEAPTTAAPPARTAYCEVAFEIGSGLPPTVRWCDDPFAGDVEAAAARWRFTSVPAPVRRSLGVYFEPTGDVDVVVWGRAPDEGPWPFDVTYGDPPKPSRVRPPSWPEDADRKVGQVTCVIRGRVTPSGRFVDADPPECPAAFAEAALKRARTWRFEPAKVDGERRTAEYTARIVFRP